jgi:hypothetical protein
MRFFYPIIILLLCTMSCNEQIEIAGHWRPADAFQSGQDSNGDIPQFRDLILNSDSTFVSVGYDQQPPQTEGWHNGDEQKGEWNFAEGILSLKIKGISYPVKFKVLKLTTGELVMENEMMKSVELKLIRIKN